jgi:type I restriction enzyme S subunit
MVKLGQVAEFINGDRGKNYPSEGDFVDKGIPFINAGHLTYGEVDYSDMNYISESRFELLGSGKTRQNDILYCLRGSLGKTAIVRQKGDAAIASSLVIIRPSDDCSVGYLYHFLTSPSGHVQVRRFDNGSSQPNLSANSVKNYLLPLPPLAQQRRIAEVLDRAEALRAKRRAALAQLDSLAQSIFLDLFGDPATNPKGWQTITLGDALVAIRNGANPEQRTEPGGWPITRIETIADGTINPQRVRWIEPNESLTEGFQLRPGDILFSHINSVEHIAKTALYSGEPTPLIHGINLLRLRPKLDSVEPVWLLHLLKHDVVRTHFRTRCKRAVNQAILNQPDIKSLGTFLPPLALQREFARQVVAVEKLKRVQRTSLAELDALFASLQHRGFRGEL